MASDRVHELCIRRLDSRGADIDPLRFAQEVLEGSRQRCRVDAYRYDSATFGRSPLNLLTNVGRGDRLLGENQNDDLGVVDRPNDLIGVEGPRDNIPRRDPTL